MIRRVRISNCEKAVFGDDKATLDALWAATKDLIGPYLISRAPRNGDGELYIIKDVA